MARTHARVQAALWLNEDWRALSALAQRVYLLLISQPQINNCGVLPLVLKRWARLAADTSPRDVTDALGELEQARFIVCDWETEEVLVRTFIRHDRVEEQPNLKTAAKRQLLEIESRRIQHVLAKAHEWLTEDVPPPLLEDLQEPLSEEDPEPLPEPLREGRTREGHRDEGVGVGMEGGPDSTPTHTKDQGRARRREPMPEEVLRGI